MKKTYKTYSEEFKWEVVQLYLKGSGTLRSIAAQYEIWQPKAKYEAICK
ncbi:transposase [Bacillus sp. FJAT-51639]|uniref:Transposase n=1 Tax=Bacillus bruguierae TaxID=3127667 RepID=A0ABU8FBF3_9BACI